MVTGNYYVYITTNPGKSVLYTGMTNDLKVRLLQHFQNRGDKSTFAGRYYCYKLLHYETFPEAILAIAREKEIKDMSREKKKELIAASILIGIFCAFKACAIVESPPSVAIEHKVPWVAKRSQYYLSTLQGVARIPEIVRYFYAASCRRILAGNPGGLPISTNSLSYKDSF